MTGKRVSIFEVAKAAGVSHQTVSRVINHSPNVSPATRAKVQAAIDELGYRPSGAARALATNRTRTIALIAGGMSYFGPLSTISSIEDMARKHGLYVSIAIMNDHEYTQEAFEQVANACLDQGVEAFVFVAPTDPMVEAALKARLRVPRVILTSSHGAVDVEPYTAKDPTIAVLGIDQWSAMRDIVRHLSSLGHRRALYLAGPSEWRDAETRRIAWLEESAKAGLDTQVIDLTDWGSSLAYDTFNAYLDSLDDPKRDLPTAIVAANDLQAMGVNRALFEHGIRVPQDVSLIGFDDMPAVCNSIPPMTTIHPDFSGLGVAAMTALFAQLGADGRIPATSAVKGSGAGGNGVAGADGANGADGAGSPSLDELPVIHGVKVSRARMVVRDSTAEAAR
ncbi:LacI family DNA-binding transcriptional regulator [Bifidobacterium simiarum]|nr:LacI family DNA-binding transcriptional regulator [Bifidobacterium simiarum]MBT1166962.1 LacI family DNA-binding transcriptional regulator [Bifidobacterium simiarum]